MEDNIKKLITDVLLQEINNIVLEKALNMITEKYPELIYKGSSTHLSQKCKISLYQIKLGSSVFPIPDGIINEFNYLVEALILEMVPELVKKGLRK